MKVFFSHASEDKPIVEQIAARVLAHLPHLDIWIDKYRIVGGEDLLAKIGAGMDEAEKSFVFVSPVSVVKPWVAAELRDALALDLAGDKPGFVVPVLVEKPDAFPAFLRSRKDIDVTKPADVWLREFEGVVAGGFHDAPQLQPNLTIRVQKGPGPAGDQGRDPDRVVTIAWSARFFAEPINLAVRTRQPVLSLRTYRRPHVAALQMVQDAVGEDGAGYRVGDPPLAAGATLFMELEFSRPASGEDIVATGPWADPSAFE